MKLNHVLGSNADGLVPVELVARRLGITVAQCRWAELQALRKLRMITESQGLQLADILPEGPPQTLWQRIESES